jgi:hypothetical protein
MFLIQLKLLSLQTREALSMLLKLLVLYYLAFCIIYQGLNSRLFVIILKILLKRVELSTLLVW